MKQDALEKAYTQYYRDIFLYALSLCRNTHVAEDLASDTFFKAFLTLEGEVVKYWLLRVCKNLYIDKYRKDKRLAALDQAMADEGVESAMERTLRKERNAELYRCMLRLPMDQRSAVYMQYFMGMDMASVAAVLGKSPGSVRTMLTRARAKHRSCEAAQAKAQFNPPTACSTSGVKGAASPFLNKNSPERGLKQSE